MTFIALFFPLLLLGVALLWLGLRGRRVDDHPICRRCGFDLFGRPPGSDHCSECGADLTKPRTIRDGRRVRRGGMIAVGALLLAIALTVGGGAGVAVYSVQDWQPHKPVWWLAREIEPGRGDQAVRTAAISELLLRLANVRLTQAEVDAVADKVLDMQADPKKPWHNGFGDFLESARALKMLSDERWQRYGRQATQFTLEVRQWVRMGDPIPFQIRETGVPRTGTRSEVRFRRAVPVFVGGEAFGAQLLRDDAGLFGSPASPVTGKLAATDYQPRLREGAQQFRVLLDLEMDRSFILGPKPVEMTTLELTTDLKIFAPYDFTVLLVRDPTVEAQMYQAVRTASAKLAQTGANRELVVTVECKSPPVGVGYAVVVSMDGQLASLGTIACPPKTSRVFRLACPASVNRPRHGVCTVLYYPSTDAAVASIDTFEMWNGVIRHENVEVE